MKVLLAVDGSDYTKRMLAWLAAHDEMFDRQTTYTVLTVVPSIDRYASVLDLAQPLVFHTEQAERVLRPVRAFAAQQGWQASFGHAVGDAAQEIAAAADSNRADLVVLGSHGHTALGNLVLGSVATEVLARCKTPVLLIR